MKKYRMYKKDNTFVIKETSTDKVIYVSKLSNRTQELYKRLNGSSGFEGESPNFFFNKKDQIYA